MTGMRTNREPAVRFQGGAWVGSELREGNSPFRGSPEGHFLLLVHSLEPNQPCYLSLEDGASIVSPKRQHRPTYHHSAKTQK
jgi:hypothetical protein